MKIYRGMKLDNENTKERQRHRTEITKDRECRQLDGLTGRLRERERRDKTHTHTHRRSERQGAHTHTHTHRAHTHTHMARTHTHILTSHRILDDVYPRSYQHARLNKPTCELGPRTSQAQATKGESGEGRKGRPMGDKPAPQKALTKNRTKPEQGLGPCQRKGTGRRQLVVHL